jgi:hypothetical protein
MNEPFSCIFPKEQSVKEQDCNRGSPSDEASKEEYLTLLRPRISGATYSFQYTSGEALC